MSIFDPVPYLALTRALTVRWNHWMPGVKTWDRRGRRERRAVDDVHWAIHGVHAGVSFTPSTYPPYGNPYGRLRSHMFGSAPQSLQDCQYPAVLIGFDVGLDHDYDLRKLVETVYTSTVWHEEESRNAFLNILDAACAEATRRNTPTPRATLAARYPGVVR